MNVKFIGLGGIGSSLVMFIARYLKYSEHNFTITLIDGKRFRAANFKRQVFNSIDNKAVSKAIDLLNMGVQANVVSEYVNENNIGNIILEHNFIFLSVDNHRTRRMVSLKCEELNNITLISGGNELTDGGVQIYVKRDGIEHTPDIRYLHPEIDNPVDKAPYEMSCEELEVSEPQIYFTNIGVAFFMCCAFYNILNGVYVPSVCFDINKMRASSGTVKPRKRKCHD